MNSTCLLLLISLIVIWLIYRSNKDSMKNKDSIQVFLPKRPKGGLWEVDFIKNDLLGDISTEYIEISENSDVNIYKNMNIRENIFIYSSNEPSNSYDKVLEIVKFLKPGVIIHLSDEWGDKPKHNELAKYTNLLLRQHLHPSYPSYDNIKYMSLAYMTDMFEPNYLQTPLKNPLERKYRWCFVGALKQDRQKMVDTLSDIQPNYVNTTGNVKPSEMREIQRDSIFSVNGRGNVHLDGNRTYQGNICGSIPVIVGSDKEVRETIFMLYDEDPPWIVAESWDEAKKKMLYLLQNKELLLQQYNKLRPWWINVVQNTKNHIFNAIYNE